MKSNDLLGGFNAYRSLNFLYLYENKLTEHETFISNIIKNSTTKYNYLIPNRNKLTKFLMSVEEKNILSFINNNNIFAGFEFMDSNNKIVFDSIKYIQIYPFLKDITLKPNLNFSRYTRAVMNVNIMNNIFPFVPKINKTSGNLTTGYTLHFDIIMDHMFKHFDSYTNHLYSVEERLNNIKNSIFFSIRLNEHYIDNISCNKNIEFSKNKVLKNRFLVSLGERKFIKEKSVYECIIPITKLDLHPNIISSIILKKAIHEEKLDNIIGKYDSGILNVSSNETYDAVKLHLLWKAFEIDNNVYVSKILDKLPIINSLMTNLIALKLNELTNFKTQDDCLLNRIMRERTDI